MPIYSYKCSKCGKVFDKFQKPGSNGKVLCEYCDGEAIRIFSPVGIIFKGSGFYKTDYGNPNSVTQASKKKEKAKEEKDSKTDNKPKSSSKDSTKSK